MTPGGSVRKDQLAERIAGKAGGRERLLVGIAGPPGSGKSTLADSIAEELNHQRQNQAIVLPMDGFHLDNAVLEGRGLLPRKGAPETFDVDGFSECLQRLAGLGDVAIPLFDRRLDLARAAAAIITAEHRIVLVEGNYLLLNVPPWNRFASLFGLTVWINVPEQELEQRLIQRWLDHGYDERGAQERAMSNDMPNVRMTRSQSRQADINIDGIA